MTTGSQNRFPVLRFLEDPSPPATPPAGEVHCWADEATKTLHCIDDTGATVDLADTGTAGLAAGISFVIDGGGAEITTGVKGFLEVPFACTITAVRLLADQSGSIVVDIWNDTYANYPPTDADSITASAVPTISTATKAEDTTLTGWDVDVAAGDILGFNVDSVTDIERVTVALEVERV
jgi:hypothetical protein